MGLGSSGLWCGLARFPTNQTDEIPRKRPKHSQQVAKKILASSHYFGKMRSHMQGLHQVGVIPLTFMRPSFELRCEPLPPQSFVAYVVRLDLANKLQRSRSSTHASLRSKWTYEQTECVCLCMTPCIGGKCVAMANMQRLAMGLWVGLWVVPSQSIAKVWITCIVARRYGTAPIPQSIPYILSRTNVHMCVYCTIHGFMMLHASLSLPVRLSNCLLMTPSLTP